MTCILVNTILLNVDTRAHGNNCATAQGSRNTQQVHIVHLAEGGEVFHRVICVQRK